MPKIYQKQSKNRYFFSLFIKFSKKNLHNGKYSYNFAA